MYTISTKPDAVRMPEHLEKKVEELRTQYGDCVYVGSTFDAAYTRDQQTGYVFFVPTGGGEWGRYTYRPVAEKPHGVSDNFWYGNGRG